MTRLGRVAALWRYPFKSMAGETLARARLTDRGLPGDRGWALRDADGRLASAKRFPSLMLCAARYAAEPAGGAPPEAELELPGGLRLWTSDSSAAQRLSELAGKPMTLEGGEPGRHFDSQPVHIVTTATLAAMKTRRPESAWDARRFRPNVLIETDGLEGFPELEWSGRRLRVGSAVLAVGKPTARCVMTTHGQPRAGLDADPGVLWAVGEAAQGRLGVYACVVEPGEAGVGEAVLLEP